MQNYGKMISLFKKYEVSIGKNVTSNQLFRKLDYLILELLYMYLKKSLTVNFLVLSCCLDAQPTESEKEIYNQVNVVLKDAEGILEDLQSYRGAGHEIREVKIPVPLFNLYCFLYCVVCFHSQSYLKEDYLHYFRSGCSDIRVNNTRFYNYVIYIY